MHEMTRENDLARSHMNRTEINFVIAKKRNHRKYRKIELYGWLL